MIATLYTTVGRENYRDEFATRAAAEAAFALTVQKAQNTPEIRGAVLDLGGRNVRTWSA